MQSLDVIPDSLTLAQIGEPYASGFFEEPEAPPILRFARAHRRWLEAYPLPAYNSELLYPAGHLWATGRVCVMNPCSSFTYSYDGNLLKERLAEADEETANTLRALDRAVCHMREAMVVPHTVHTLGGGGFTHSIPNYGRILHEGFGGYAERIVQGAERDGPENYAFYAGLSDLLEGVGTWHRRMVDLLERAGTPPAEKLIEALGRVPFLPARNFFEAAVAYNFIFYLDCCDDPGRVDQELWPYYEKDRAAGRITYEEAKAIIRQMWIDCDINWGWSAAIGGTDSKGGPAYNELTLACLEAAEHLRRPNLQLHVRRDMPAEVWNAALSTLATGCGLPALHNEEAFIDSLRSADLGIREEDLGAYNGGGCTETMIHGLSNVGSLDAGINLPLVLRHTLGEQLGKMTDFESLTASLKLDIVEAIGEIERYVNADQEAKSRLRPQPMRSLLIDDCIDTGVEYNAGGARYNWSVINVAGLANVVDSLAAIREMIFERGEISGPGMLKILNRDFKGDEEIRQRLSLCPKYGNDDPKADDIAKDISGFVFEQFLKRKAWRGGRFVPSCLMFTTYAGAGKPVGATPDGRLSGDPIADSAGPHQGRDRSGPTAMLKSVAGIPQHLAPGTLVVNIRFSKKLFAGDEGRRHLKSLFRTYFDMGGMQLQVNVVDQEVLEDAIAHPEKHEDLVVRIGGYSEYFNSLSPELKQTILLRTEHEM